VIYTSVYYNRKRIKKKKLDKVVRTSFAYGDIVTSDVDNMLGCGSLTYFAVI